MLNLFRHNNKTPTCRKTQIRDSFYIMFHQLQSFRCTWSSLRHVTLLVIFISPQFQLNFESMHVTLNLRNYNIYSIFQMHSIYFRLCNTVSSFHFTDVLKAWHRVSQITQNDELLIKFSNMNWHKNVKSKRRISMDGICLLLL